METETVKTNRSRYNFEQNLLELSQSDDIDDALTEWRVINKNYEVLSEGKVVCICNKTIKRVHYVCNIQTNKFAYLGTGCVGKFRNKLTHITNKTLRNVFMDMISDGMYEQIFDLHEYSDEVKSRLINHFENDRNFKTLNDKLKELKELIDDHGCLFLTVLYDKYHCSCCKRLLFFFGREDGTCTICDRLTDENKEIVKNLQQTDEEEKQKQEQRKQDWRLKQVQNNVRYHTCCECNRLMKRECKHYLDKKGKIQCPLRYCWNMSWVCDSCGDGAKLKEEQKTIIEERCLNCYSWRCRCIKDT